MNLGSLIMSSTKFVLMETDGLITICLYNLFVFAVVPVFTYEIKL
jgi:hypothetical protein